MDLGSEPRRADWRRPRCPLLWTRRGRHHSPELALGERLDAVHRLELEDLELEVGASKVRSRSCVMCARVN